MKKLNTGWTPEGLAAELAESIKGQDRYLKDLALVLWLHHLRKEQYKAGEKSGFPKVNLMVLGKSGTGKTSSIRAMADVLDMPVIIEDTSQLTGSGWKGRDVSEIACRIEETAGDDADRRFAVVVLDEIDKLYNNGNHMEANSPVNNLLKLIEGMRLSHRDSHGSAATETENLLFICLGAFDGLEDIIRKRLNPGRNRIGFSGIAEEKRSEDETDILHKAAKEDLAAYGMSPQLLGRIGLITATNELKAEVLEEIILDSDISAVKQFDRLLTESMGVGVSISPAAAKHIAETACEEQTGARALGEKLFAAYKEGLYGIAGREGISGMLLDAERGGLTIKYREGEWHRKDDDKERSLYEKVPLGLESRTAKGAVLRAESIIDETTGHGKGSTYSQLRAVACLYIHIISVILKRGRKDPTMADMGDVLMELMEESITGDLCGKSRSLDKSMEYQSDIHATLWNGRQILQSCCRRYLADQEEMEKAEQG